LPTAKEAIQELLEMSASIRQAVLVRGESEILASTFANAQSEATMVSIARRMLEEARTSAKEMERSPLTQLFVETASGCVFIVTGDKDTWLAASTGADPTVGLVLYDANTALRTALEGEADEGDYGK
jgi:predicted regulator of Ras-like GTPase activity (Roadblock/LC7/MglB family)